MRIAMLGTRGVPARYGGFETAVDEIGSRLAAAGHEVIVYCRGIPRPRPTTHNGMRLVHLPAIKSRIAETLSHTGLSAIREAVSTPRADAAIVFNAANAPFLPLLRARRIPVAVHVDGLEWKRAKWGSNGQRYYRFAEALAVRWSDALIADAEGIAEYYRQEFDVATELLSYGAPVLYGDAGTRLATLDLAAREFHLVVARFEPENHVEQIVAGYHASAAQHPLVVVGSAPYADAYTGHINAIADADHRIRMLGAVWDQELLNELYTNALTYLHGHSVGGTNPSLLRAMGAGTPVVAYDVSFNREVAGPDAAFFSTPADVSRRLESVEVRPAQALAAGSRLRDRARGRYRWDDVARGYAGLLERMAAGVSVRGSASGRRTCRHTRYSANARDREESE